MWHIVRSLVASGVTIFLTTQYLEEADELADRIAVLDHGKLVSQGTAAELKRLVPGGHISLQFADASVFARAAQILQPTSRDDDALTLQLPGGGDVRSLRSVLDRLDQAGIEADGLTVHTPDLDDVFLALTGQPESRPRPQEAIA
jgi:ABC-2 type transport system ATP-binding protein